MNPLFIAGAQATRHALLRTISVLCVLAVAAGLWFAVDRAFIHPKPSQSYAQKAEQITNVEHNYFPDDDLFFFGVKLFGFKLGISKNARIEK